MTHDKLIPPLQGLVITKQGEAQLILSVAPRVDEADVVLIIGDDHFLTTSSKREMSRCSK